MNPEDFPIQQKIELGLWPDTQIISYSLVPYINRMKQDKITIMIVGDSKGESAYDFLTRCPKVVKISCVENDEQYKSVFETNTKAFGDKVSTDEIGQTELVCLVGTLTDDRLKKYYPFVKSGGIFAGNNHELAETKEHLNKYRRFTKIGTPILVANKTTWFWNKR